MAGYTLYGFWRSSCSARLRICLNMKGIPHSSVPVNLLEGEHLSAHHKRLNPSSSVPVLVHNKTEGSFQIGQSMAAMEYLSEVLDNAFLPPPSDANGRATVRVLANIIASDTQPVTNIRIMKRVTALGGDAEEWNRGLMQESFNAYESVVADVAGLYSYGNNFSIADACLVPAVWNARRLQIDMESYPTITRIMSNLEQLDGVQRAHPLVQPDTPSEFRA